MESAAVAAIWAFLKGLPLLVYPLALASLGFLYERHEVHSLNQDIVVIKAQDAVDKIKALKKKADADDRINAALQGEIDAAKTREATAAADAASSAAAAGKLSDQLAAVKRQLGAANHSTAAADVDASRAAVGVLADLLAERKRADQARSRFADAADSASIGCAGQYRSLKPPAGAPPAAPG